MAFIILEKHAYYQENYYIQLAVADMDQLIPTLVTHRDIGVDTISGLRFGDNVLNKLKLEGIRLRLPRNISLNT